MRTLKRSNLTLNLDIECTKNQRVASQNLRYHNTYRLARDVFQCYQEEKGFEFLFSFDNTQLFFRLGFDDDDEA